MLVTRYTRLILSETELRELEGGVVLVPPETNAVIVKEADQTVSTVTLSQHEIDCLRSGTSLVKGDFVLLVGPH